MARRDADGYIQLVDRKSNMIISGGENIYPSEVEAVIGAHAKVKDVAVIGIPHEKWGETVLAVVVLHERAQETKAAEAEILEWCKERMAGYKRPRSDRLHGRCRHAAHGHRQDPAPARCARSSRPTARFG
jgi:acyl-CoA synthetase (AMP-forming)/AMP-acid ligase II